MTNKESRSDYYNKWDQKAKEMVDEVDAEEKAAEEAAYTAPKGPATEMAEKQREQQTSFSKAREAMYGEGLAGVGAKKKVFDKIVEECKPKIEEIANKVVCVENSENFRFRLPEYGDIAGIAGVLSSNLDDGDKVEKLAQSTPIKLDITDCKNATIEVSSALITRTVEVHRCSDLVLEIDEDMLGVKAVETIQLDDSSNICIIVKSAAKSLPNIYQANVYGLTLKLLHGSAKEKEIFVEIPEEEYSDEEKKKHDEDEIAQLKKDA